MQKITERSVPSIHPYAALVIGVISVSTGAIFARMAEAPALVIAAYRVGVATLILTPFAWIKVKNELLNLSVQELGFAAISGFFLALHFSTWISSLDYTSIANSVVLVNTNPLWVGLLSPVIAKERISRAAVLSIIVSVIGGIVIGVEDFRTDLKLLWGDGLALAGSICAAIYLLLGRTLRRKLSLLAYVTICYCSAAVFLWTVVLFVQMQISGFSQTTWISLCAMAIIAQTIGHTCYNWALKWFSASLIAVSLLGEPIGSTIMAYFIFNEGLTWPKAVGGALILSAIYIAASCEKKLA